MYCKVILAVKSVFHALKIDRKPSPALTYASAVKIRTIVLVNCAGASTVSDNLT